MGQRLGDQTHSEVVESGIGQPTPGDIFGELIQHLGVLGLEGDKDKNTSTWVASVHLSYYLSLETLLAREKKGYYQIHFSGGETLTLSGHPQVADLLLLLPLPARPLALPRALRSCPHSHAWQGCCGE